MHQAKESVILMTPAELTGLLNEAARRAASEVIKRLPGIGQARPQHVTRVQAAEMLGCSPATITAYIKARKLSINQLGKISVSQMRYARKK